MTDIAVDRFDAGIRLGEQVAQDMIAVRIGPDFQHCVVGTPFYFQKHGRTETPHDLTEHNCIGLRLPASGGLWLWPFVKECRELKVRPQGRLAFNTIAPQLDCTLAGRGLGYLPEDIVQEQLADGRLTRVLADWSLKVVGYHMYYPSLRQHTPAFSLLLNALRSTMSTKRLTVALVIIR